MPIDLDILSCGNRPKAVYVEDLAIDVFPKVALLVSLFLSAVVARCCFIGVPPPYGLPYVAGGAGVPMTSSTKTGR